MIDELGKPWGLPQGRSLFRKDNDLRIDWHEPDNQDVSAFIIGNNFDNAMGESF